MYTLGINWKWHSASAALLDASGEVVFFAEEERYTGTRHAWGEFPRKAAEAALKSAGISRRDVDTVAVGWDVPLLHERVGGWPYASDAAVLADALGWELRPSERVPRVEFISHHRAHAMSAFGASPFAEAAILVVDGHGEDESVSFWKGRRGVALRHIESWPRSCSIGYLYDAATQELGFGSLDGGKTMGLSTYGRVEGLRPDPLMRMSGGELESILRLPHSLGYNAAIAAWRAHFADSFGQVRFAREDLHLDEVAKAIAWSAQATVEDLIPVLVERARAVAGIEAVCFAGGVALNCVANGLLQEPIYVPPFPHDAGVAIGAAWTIVDPPPRQTPLTPFLGDYISDDEVATALNEADLQHWAKEASIEVAADRLCRGAIGAVASGRAEVGPRALGARSLVAVPRPSDVRDDLNRRKGREPWRPFAPVAREADEASLWSPPQGMRNKYMVGSSLVSELGKELLPAAVHVDGSTRPQVVDDSDYASGQVFPAILGAIGQHQEIPVLLNTSLNGPGRPIVGSAREALGCFDLMGLDFLLFDSVLVLRDK